MRAMEGGAEALRPHEMIELVLFSALPRRDVNALAHDLIGRFGGLRGVLEAGEAALRTAPGVGARAARMLSALGEACAAYAQLRAEDRPYLGNLRSFRAFAEAYRPLVQGEETWQFCLTGSGRLLLARPIAPGRCWAEPEYLRAALDDVLRSGGESVLLAQFVDQQAPGPDPEDVRDTDRYARALEKLDAPLVDHLLVGAGGAYSMRASGELRVRDASTQEAALCEQYLRDDAPADWADWADEA